MVARELRNSLLTRLCLRTIFLLLDLLDLPKGGSAKSSA